MPRQLRGHSFDNTAKLSRLPVAESCDPPRLSLIDDPMSASHSYTASQARRTLLYYFHVVTDIGRTSVTVALDEARIDRSPCRLLCCLVSHLQDRRASSVIRRVEILCCHSPSSFHDTLCLLFDSTFTPNNCAPSVSPHHVFRQWWWWFLFWF